MLGLPPAFIHHYSNHSFKSSLLMFTFLRLYFGTTEWIEMSRFFFSLFQHNKLALKIILSRQLWCEACNKVYSMNFTLCDSKLLSLYRIDSQSVALQVINYVMYCSKAKGHEA